MAVLLKRTLVLPAEVCDCATEPGSDPRQELRAPAAACAAGAAPFGCALRLQLPLEKWIADGRVEFRPAALLRGPFPEEIAKSHCRLLLPDGMDDSELSFALRMYKDTRLLEVERAGSAFCGWDTRMPGNAEREANFASYARELIGEDVALHPCTHFRGGTGEVLQFKNVGQQDERHLVIADRERLPPSIASLPNGTDIVVTFATGSVATMAINWVRTTERAWGEKRPVLIGALDVAMMTACKLHNAPCILIDGGEVSKELSEGAGSNLRSRPKLYPKMSVLKVGFYGQLLSFGFNVWACDADAIFMSDPRPLLASSYWPMADVAIATDCIDIPGDSRYPLLHCDFNTGMVYLRSRPAVRAFTERWRETVANAKETRIRDQAAFNMLTKARPLKNVREPATNKATRIFEAALGDLSLRIGVLPLAQFLNGHTYFVQHAHTLPAAKPPISVHMTYQFAEGAKFAYGKRQRLRQAGLWLVDDAAYFRGKYLSVSAEGANLELKPMGPSVDSRDAVAYHLKEHAHRIKVLRSLFGIAKALGRVLILPRMLCYCDFMWKEMKNCRVGGAESMRLPFDCPMDHVLDTPAFFYQGELGSGMELTDLGVSVREPSFLQNPLVPANVSASVAKVSLPKGGLNDAQVRSLLAPHASAAVIELSAAADAFCGFADAAENALFVDVSQQLLTYRRSPFCMMEGSDNAPLFSQCCSPRKPGDKFFPCIQGFDAPAALPRCSQQ